WYAACRSAFVKRAGGYGTRILTCSVYGGGEKPGYPFLAQSGPGTLHLLRTVFAGKTAGDGIIIGRPPPVSGRRPERRVFSHRIQQNRPCILNNFEGFAYCNLTKLFHAAQKMRCSGCENSKIGVEKPPGGVIH